MLSPRLKFYEGWAIKRSDKPPSASANPDAPKKSQSPLSRYREVGLVGTVIFTEKAAATPIAYFLLAGKYRLTISPSWFNC
jgi:hypothetical protein